MRIIKTIKCCPEIVFFPHNHVAASNDRKIVFRLNFALQLFEMKALEGFTILLALVGVIPRIEGCIRVPPGVTAAKSPVDDNYVLSVNGNTQSYVPGQRYNGE